MVDVPEVRLRPLQLQMQGRPDVQAGELAALLILAFCIGGVIGFMAAALMFKGPQ